MNPKAVLLCAFTFVAGVFVSQVWQSLKTTYFWRPVQYLRSPDRRHQATLERVDGLDLNFRVLVDDTPIYHSPDFRPSLSQPLRETLLWDDAERVLTLEVLGRRLFGYDATHNRQLSNQELLGAKVTPWPIERYGFEGTWPTSAFSPIR